mmetsp:Transcript_3934/g.10012  ORF Transcript_3934/g.10012 Transcript_3934/m.10012 type:complete len:86 (+) Transcript_3934:40-297(+)
MESDALPYLGRLESVPWMQKARPPINIIKVKGLLVIDAAIGVLVSKTDPIAVRFMTVTMFALAASTPSLFAVQTAIEGASTSWTR